MRMMPSSFLQKKRAATWSLTPCQGGLRHPPPAAGQPRFRSGPLLATRGDSQTEKHRPARRGHQHSRTRPGSSHQLRPPPLSARLLPPIPAGLPARARGPRSSQGRCSPSPAAENRRAARRGARPAAPPSRSSCAAARFVSERGRAGPLPHRVT